MSAQVPIPDYEYGLRILGDELAPDLADGGVAVFHPAVKPGRGDIAAVWLRDKPVPSVVRLALALPPFSDASDEVDPQLAVEAGGKGRMAFVSMTKVRAIHRLVRVQDAQAVRQ